MKGKNELQKKMTIKASMKYNNGNINNLRKLIDESFSRAFLRQQYEKLNNIREEMNEKYGTNYEKETYDYNNINVIGY